MPTAKNTAYPFLIAAILAAALLPFAAGQAPSPAPDCFTSLLQLSDCLTYVENGSSLTVPDTGCCPGLSNLVSTQPICLCTLLGNPDQLGIPIDYGKALELPSVCNVAVPPISECGASDTPPIGLPPSEGAAPPPTEGAAPPPTEEITPAASEAPTPVSPGVAPAPVEVPSSPSSDCRSTDLKMAHSFLMGSAALLFSYLLY